ncbi:hypothetical protein J7K24_02160 [bacterium]|nr:hypothetical protein [bacterium]
MKENEVYIVETECTGGSYFELFRTKEELDRWIRTREEISEKYGNVDPISHVYIAREVKFEIKTKEVPITKKVAYIVVKE